MEVEQVVIRAKEEEPQEHLEVMMEEEMIPSGIK